MDTAPRARTIRQASVEPGGLLHLYDEVGIPATELWLPGPDGQTLEAEIPKWLEISPRVGAEYPVTLCDLGIFAD